MRRPTLVHCSAATYLDGAAGDGDRQPGSDHARQQARARARRRPRAGDRGRARRVSGASPSTWSTSTWSGHGCSSESAGARQACAGDDRGPAASLGRGVAEQPAVARARDVHVAVVSWHAVSSCASGSAAAASSAACSSRRSARGSAARPGGRQPCRDVAGRRAQRDRSGIEQHPRHHPVGQGHRRRGLPEGPRRQRRRSRRSAARPAIRSTPSP